MAVDLAKYVVSLEAETARYTQQLQQANNKLEQFEQRNTASLKRLDRGFFEMSNRFTMVAAKIRSVASLFGVAFGVRAFAGWIKDAIEVEKLTNDQAKAIGRAREEMDALGDSVGDVAREFVTRLAPSIETAARWWKELLFPSGSQFGQAADQIREQVDKQIEEVERLQRLLQTRTDYQQNANPLQRLLFGDGAANVAETTRELAAARVELERLRSAWDAAMGGGGSRSFNDFFGGGPPDAAQLAFQRKVQEDQRRAISAGQDLSPEIRSFVQQLEAGEKLTEAMRTDVEQQVDEWRKAKQLFDAGVISGEALTRVRDSLLQPVEVTARRMKTALEEIEDKAAATAAFMGQTFKGAFTSWITGVDRDFKQLLKNMAAQMVTSGIFEAFAGMFSGSSTGIGKFFASFFGGARGNGGPVFPGMAYLVGETGPEIFVPNTAGAIVPGAGGMSVSITNAIDARGADQGLIARLPAILEANNQKVMARIKDLNSRNRF